MKFGLFLLVAAAGVVLAPVVSAQTAPAPPAEESPPAPTGPAGIALRPIEPANALEHSFMAALTNEAMRPIFRRQLMESHVALAVTSYAADAPPLEVTLADGLRAYLIFTSSERLDEVMGPETPRLILTGRAALERLRGKSVIINARLIPMLTLEPDDVSHYLEAPESPDSAGPAQ